MIFIYAAHIYEHISAYVQCAHTNHIIIYLHYTVHTHTPPQYTEQVHKRARAVIQIKGSRNDWCMPQKNMQQIQQRKQKIKIYQKNRASRAYGRKAMHNTPAISRRTLFGVSRIFFLFVEYAWRKLGFLMVVLCGYIINCGFLFNKCIWVCVCVCITLII